MASWGDQFSKGDQSAMRQIFWATSYKKCPRCSHDEPGTIISETFCAGCRHNGDGYGTEVFTCTHCGWETSFQYDESDTPYFYETRRFSEASAALAAERLLNPPPEDIVPTVVTYRAITNEDIALFQLRLQRGLSPSYVRKLMHTAPYLIQDSDIDGFFSNIETTYGSVESFVELRQKEEREKLAAAQNSSLAGSTDDLANVTSQCCVSS